MSTVTLPRIQIPLTSGGERVSPEWYRWMHDVTIRAGGVTGVGTDDLAVSQFDDAGIEETKFALELLARSIDQAPSNEQQRVSQLEDQLAEALAQINELRREVAGIQQGYTA